MENDPKQHEPVLYDNDEERVKSPAIWLVFIAVPLVIGLLMGFFDGEEAFAPAPEPVVVQPQETARKLDGATADMPFIAQAIEATRGKDVMGKPPEISAPPCNFEAWVGLEVREDMLNAIRDARRPYRILPPGSAITMDHAPARINFDLDDAGKITRVWCG